MAKPIFRTPDIKMLVDQHHDFATPKLPLAPKTIPFETPPNQDLDISFCSPEMIKYFLSDLVEPSLPSAESTMGIDERIVLMHVPVREIADQWKNGEDSLLNSIDETSPVNQVPKEKSDSNSRDEGYVQLVTEYKALLKDIPATKIKFISITTFAHEKESYNVIAACSSDSSTTEPMIANVLKGNVTSAKLHGFILYLWKELHFFDQHDFVILGKRSETTAYEIHQTLSSDLWMSDNITLICTPANTYDKLHPMSFLFKLLRERIQLEVKRPHLPESVNSRYHVILAAIASISYEDIRSAYTQCGYH